MIVPVYGDFRATRTCLDIVAGEVGRAVDHHLLIVNDATPDPRIARYLDEIARRPSVSLIENTRNLGFVGSINRALEAVPGGDVILLNADTVPPPDFIHRLARAAYSEPDIGAIVPLSNNAEATSFPLPFVASPLPSIAGIAAIDRIATDVGRGRLVDIPSGTGFCMYLTMRCLEAVGYLSRRYHRGYFEDVDLCLRARERGFRIVCDPSIYVGHAGTRSFGREKAALVLRNFRELALRFPDYVRDATEFAAADPLRTARAAIEARAIEAKDGARLIVTGVGVVGTVARDRAGQLARDDLAAFIAEFGKGGNRSTARFSAADGGMPQSIECDVASPDGRNAFLDVVGRLGVSVVEVADPAEVPDAFLDLLANMDVPHDLLVADDGLLTEEGQSVEPREGRSSTGRAMSWHHARRRMHSFSANLDPKHAERLVPGR